MTAENFSPKPASILEATTFLSIL